MSWPDAKLQEWQNRVGPLILAMIVVYSFWPYTFFTWLPFTPAVAHLPQIYSGILVGSMSNLEYESIRRLGTMFKDLIGRVAK
jgi:hypothetical protein